MKYRKDNSPWGVPIPQTIMIECEPDGRICKVAKKPVTRQIRVKAWPRVLTVAASLTSIFVAMAFLFR